jgi:ATP-dependent RNA helicase RhlE
VAFHSYYKIRKPNPGSNFARKKEFFDMNIFTRKAEAVQAQIYTPKNSFSDFKLGDILNKNLATRGFGIPTQIQDQAIVPALEGRDILGLANTGSGKTGAFLLPLIEKVSHKREDRVLIVAPTRELAVQINDEFLKLARGLGLYSVTCIGGVGMGWQIQNLRRRPNFVVGTPGRLLDLENQGVVNFGQFYNLVLDEADRMLDMGFIPDVRRILSKLPKQRQSMVFSATMPDNIRQLTREVLNNPVVISVRTDRGVVNINQDVVKTGGRPKTEVLHELLIKDGFDKVLIFGRTKHGIDKLEQELIKKGFKVAAIHGNKSQGQRQRALTDFKTNRLKVLLATDIASRGLDINDVTHVINYDLPESFDDYTHRIGRTARAGKTGIALTFVN